MSTGYRPPSDQPRGQWARFLHARRKERGWSQTKAFDELYVGLKLSPKSRTSYINLDMGKRQPKPHEAAFLTDYFGAAPDDAPEPVEATESPADLLQAVSVLLEEIRAERRARVEWETGFLEAMRELVRAAVPSGDPEPAPRAVAQQ